MSNGEGTREATSAVASADPLDSIPSLRVRQSDGADASPPSSRYSSCGESEFDRYCSANSVMGTPSMCSTITVFNDFGFGDDSGLENSSLGERAEISHNNQRLPTSGVSDSTRVFSSGFGRVNNQNQQHLKYGFSGLELYGDDKDELTMTMLDTSSLMGVNQIDEHSRQNFVHKDHARGHNELGPRDDVENQSSDGSDNAGTKEKYLLGDVDEKFSQSVQAVGEGSLSCAHGREDELHGFDVQSSSQIGEREVEGEKDGNSSNFEHSEGENSMYNYGSDNDNKNEFHLPRNRHYPQESKVQNENPLLMNSFTAFGSEDLDDLLLENGVNARASHMFDAFRCQNENNPEVEDDRTKFSFVNSMKFSSPGQKEEAKDTNDTDIDQQVEEIKEVRDIPAAQGTDKLANIEESSFDASTYFPKIVKPQNEDEREVYVAKSQVLGADKLVTCSKSFSIAKPYEVDHDPLAEEVPSLKGLNAIDDGTIEKGQLHTKTDVIGASDVQHVDNLVLNSSKLSFDLAAVNENCSLLAKHLGNTNTELSEDLEQDEPSSIFGRRETLESSSASGNLFEKNPTTTEMENFELNEFYDEVVHEMEEILLDSISSPGARTAQVNRLIEPQLSIPLRDGGSTASTSGTDDAYPLVHRPARIDGIEVVGARQKKGDVSFSERLVGVKEYTVYKIRVWSGKDQWEVERRYRDFLTLHRRMKSLFTEQGWALPLPWSSVEKESKNIFGSSSPDVVAHRSILIQECLQSILRTRFFSSPPDALIWFLFPQDSYPSSPASNALESQSSFITRGPDGQNFSTLGKTISLKVEIQPQKSIKEMLEAQHYTCAGCHRHFDEGTSLIWDFVQTFGWGKPRLCEYTGQLFCSSCHTNETAVLPARVLHNWDFTQYPVSQLAKSYLDSIHDQPMLCVSAVNPFLLSKVPALLHVMSVRKKIGTMLPYVRCPFRSSINRGLGSRIYLLESNDFFALRDLIDLSKGAFAALPVMVETVSKKILEHITDQCLICCDVGLPCSARQDCSDPSSLIFPFQEDEIKRCKKCQSVFHKPCFKKLGNCPCESHLRVDETMRLTNRVNQTADGERRGTLDLLKTGVGSGLSTRLFSGLFSKEKPTEPRDENIIFMGSLPSTTL